MSTLSITSPGLSYSEETYWLQWNLSALGFSVAQDGQFGPETRQAVMDFQYTWGLTVNGIADSGTQASIDEAINLMNQGGWDPWSDPAHYIMATIPTGTLPPVVQPPGVPTPTIRPTSPALGGIDWKWIVFGIAGAMVIFGITGKGEGKKKGKKKK